MSDLNTKQKIINASIQLCNQYGIANVRLQQIANEIGISPGNLAYHFPNKESILEAQFEEMFNEASEILTTYRLFPNLIDFDHQLSKYFQFNQRYPSYFLENLEFERNHPAIYKKQSQQIHKMIRQIRMRIDFNLKRNLLIQEPKAGIYDTLAKSIWMCIAYWYPENIARCSDQTSMYHFKSSIWDIIYPYFTPEGFAEFDQLISPILQQRTQDQ